MKNIVINGFGRIGRLAFRQLIGSDQYKIVAINTLGTPEENAYLLKYDTVHGTFGENEISYNEEGIIFDDELIKLYSIANPTEFPWKNMNVDCILECSGAYTKYDDAMKHIYAGAKHVVISAPGKGDLKTIVYGVNDNLLTGQEQVISAASCTTNCLAPVLNLIEKTFGIEYGYMTTIHAITGDQNILDGSHKRGIKDRRGRSAADNIVPTSTGAASAIGLVIPSLKGRLDGLACRVPVTDGSLVDLSLYLKRDTTVEEINKLFKDNQSTVLKFTMDPVVSSDIIGNSCGSLVDGMATKTLESNAKFVKILAWYDNEYGYTSQMLRTMDALLNK